LLALFPAALIEMICDTKMMKRQMVEIGYNADKLPLGKLTKQHFAKGYAVLKRISDRLDDSSSKESLTELSNEFYTLIPHEFGMRRPEKIASRKLLKEK
jgi:poly [ADP-ribose] polymerase